MEWCKDVSDNTSACRTPCSDSCARRTVKKDLQGCLVAARNHVQDLTHASGERHGTSAWRRYSRKARQPIVRIWSTNSKLRILDISRGCVSLSTFVETAFARIGRPRDPCRGGSTGFPAGPVALGGRAGRDSPSSKRAGEIDVS